MPEAESNCSWRIWDEQLAMPQIRLMLTSLKHKEAERDEKGVEGSEDVEVTVVDPKPSYARRSCTRLELVNVDLDANALSQLVDVFVEHSVIQSLLVVCLDDNALGEAAAPHLCRLLSEAPNLRASAEADGVSVFSLLRDFPQCNEINLLKPIELSLRNISMTDRLCSRIIGCCAQLKQRADLLVVDIRDNGLLTCRASICISSGRRFFQRTLNIVCDLPDPPLDA